MPQELAQRPAPALASCTPLAWPTLSDAQAAQLERVFKALADRHRVRILNLLARASEPLCVCDLVLGGPAARALEQPGRVGTVLAG